MFLVYIYNIIRMIPSLNLSNLYSEQSNTTILPLVKYSNSSDNDHSGNPVRGSLEVLCRPTFQQPLPRDVRNNALCSTSRSRLDVDPPVVDSHLGHSLHAERVDLMMAGSRSRRRVFARYGRRFMYWLLT